MGLEAPLHAGDAAQHLCDLINTGPFDGAMYRQLTAVVASVFARLQMGVMIPPSWLVQMMQLSIRPLELDAGPLAAKISNWAHGSLHAGHCMPLAHD